MSKEELLKYLIAEIDLIMHDKDYRFENANGTWYSRESCRDLTNEEVFEELRTELRQFADLEAKLADSEEEHELLIDQVEEETEKLRKQIKQESDARKRFVEEVKNLKQQLAEKEKEIESYKHFKITIGTMENNQVDISSTTYTDQDKISFAVEQLEQLKKLCQEKFNWWENSEWEGDIYDKSDVSNAYFDIEANVDNQIEELKKEMK